MSFTIQSDLSLASKLANEFYGSKEYEQKKGYMASAFKSLLRKLEVRSAARAYQKTESAAKKIVLAVFDVRLGEVGALQAVSKLLDEFVTSSERALYFGSALQELYTDKLSSGAADELWFIFKFAAARNFRSEVALDLRNLQRQADERLVKLQELTQRRFRLAGMLGSQAPVASSQTVHIETSDFAAGVETRLSDCMNSIHSQLMIPERWSYTPSYAAAAGASSSESAILGNNTRPEKIKQ